MPLAQTEDKTTFSAALAPYLHKISTFEQQSHALTVAADFMTKTNFLYRFHQVNWKVSRFLFSIVS